MTKQSHIKVEIAAHKTLAMTDGVKEKKDGYNERGFEESERAGL